MKPEAILKTMRTSLTQRLSRRAARGMSPRPKKPEAQKKASLSVRIDPDINAALLALVAENRSNMSMEVNRLLAKILTAEKRLKKT